MSKWLGGHGPKMILMNPPAGNFHTNPRPWYVNEDHSLFTPEMERYTGQRNMTHKDQQAKAKSDPY